MATHPEVTVDVEINSEDQKVSSPPPDSQLVTSNGKSSVAVEHNQGRHSSRRKWPTINELFQLDGRFCPTWKAALAMSCVMGVLLDPLFFYIPIANDNKKCIGMHQGVKITAIVSRALADLPYLAHMFFVVLPKLWHLRTRMLRELSVFSFWSFIKELCKNSAYRSYIVDVLAVMPFTQILILYSYSPSNRREGMTQLQIAACNIILQYSARVIRVYQITTELSKGSGQVWLQVISFSIFHFVLASHVLGSFWYISSIQRLMSCWHQYSTCEGTETKCRIGSLACGSHTIRNMSSVNDFCRTSDLKNSTLFDFGIFLEPFESGMLGSKNLVQKITHCLWWGLKNLSSLGQNLDTTTDVYENIFAIFIFLAGMGLYVVSLNGNLQLGYKIRQETKIKEKIKVKEKEVDSWLAKNGLLENMKQKIMKCVQEKLEDNKDVDVDNILFILPIEAKSEIDQSLRLASLKKVPEFETTKDETLKKICEHLKPVTYPEASEIVRKGEPLDMILFIKQGLIRAHTTSNGTRRNGLSDVLGTYRCLEEGDIYGREVLNWALTKPTSLTELPVSTEIVKSITKVEAWALMAIDLRNAVSNISDATLPDNSPAA